MSVQGVRLFIWMSNYFLESSLIRSKAGIAGSRRSIYDLVDLTEKLHGLEDSTVSKGEWDITQDCTVGSNNEERREFTRRETYAQNGKLPLVLIWPLVEARHSSCSHATLQT